MRLPRCLLLLSVAAVPLSSLNAQDDVVMKAMRDEMARSTQLQIENLGKPYFVAYRVVETESASVGASFGALNYSNTGRMRMLFVEVRAGDYALDNSHFFTFNYDMGSSMRYFNGMAQLPLDDDYKELRRQIWLATDAQYKKAVEDLSKKRAVLQNQKRDEEPPDFSKEDPVITRDLSSPATLDRSKWEAEARALSALFRQLPGIQTSSVGLTGSNSLTRYLTSEGTSSTRLEPSIQFNASAATQAADGAQLDDFLWFQGHSMQEIPPENELAAHLRKLGADLTALRDAPTLNNYNGPVLAEGDAAAQLFRLVFVPSLLGNPRIINGMPGMNLNPNAAQPENPFLDKVGARVLPDFLSVVDNPTISEFENHRLAASYKVDEDGMRPREVRLVENGILKAVLTSRDPVRGFEHTTGSRRAGQASPSNVIVTASNGLTGDEMRAKFLALIKQRNLQFGILVRRMRNVNNAVLAYKVFPDGHEELVRNLQFFGLNAAAFKDILAASKEPNVLTVQYRPAQNNQLPIINLGGESSVPVTLVVPSLIFEDVAMRKIRAASPTPPVASHPFFDK
jgi:predicted Zn-dependent protease